MCSSRIFQSSRIGCLEWNHSLQQHVDDLRPDSQRRNRHSAVSVHACARSKHVQFPRQVSPARQDLGPHLDRSTAPQPQDPMTQGCLKRAGAQNADSKLSHIRTMNMIKVPFSHNVMQCPLGLKRHLQQPICLQPICPSGFTAKQVRHMFASCLARDPNAESLWKR